MAADYSHRNLEFDPKRMHLQLAVVILNWNNWGDTIECLESIYLSRPPHEWGVVVVDNGSTDDSIEKIQRWAEGRIKVRSKLFDGDYKNKPIPCLVLDHSEAKAGGNTSSGESISPPKTEWSGPPIVLIRVPGNLGYAGGNNVGIRYALQHGFRYIGLLNNDTVVDPEMLGVLMSSLNENAEVGILGVKTLYYDNPGTIWYAGSDLDLLRGITPFRGVGRRDGPDFSGIRATDVVSGHALFARREVFERVGLLEEDLFLIWEDTELCIRTARLSSFRICINLDARLWHKVGGISSSGLRSPAATYFANRNRLRVVRRYGTWLQRIGFLFFYLATRVPKFARLIFKGQFTLVVAEFRAFADFCFGRGGPFPHLLKTGKKR